MREIKFRAWNGKKVVPVRIEVHGEKTPILVYKLPRGVFEYPLKLMQYTGRIASSQDLYDGDIFRIHDSDNPDYFNRYAFECYWDGTGWNARRVQGPAGGYDSDYTQNWLPPLKEDCYEPEDSMTHVIVGNIYEQQKP